MDERIVFAIEAVAFAEAGHIRVDGRAYQDVRVGDRVRLDDDATILAIVDIVTYGHHVPELNRGLTGTLFLHGTVPPKASSGSYLTHAHDHEAVVDRIERDDRVRLGQEMRREMVTAPIDVLSPGGARVTVEL